MNLNNFKDFLTSFTNNGDIRDNSESIFNAVKGSNDKNDDLSFDEFVLYLTNILNGLQLGAIKAL